MKGPQAAWSESWASVGKLDPPRGFAVSVIRFGDADVGFYSVHLKSNLVMDSNPLTPQKNIAEREVAAVQLVDHAAAIQSRIMPSVKNWIVAGDFNTNKDQSLFVSEQTIDTFFSAGFANSFGNLSLARRITHPGKGKYPDATFDYILLRKAIVLSIPIISASEISDHRSVTCDVRLN